MDNQHKLIKGYRDLSQEEIDLMNSIKALGMDVKALVGAVENQLISDDARIIDDGDSYREAFRWAAIAKTDLQKGFMALTRAVARPEGF